MANIKINTESLRSSRETKRHKIQNGSNVFRILPPFGDVSVHNNYPYKKWSIVWMVDPRYGSRRPFASPMTDGEKCPVDEYNKKLTSFIEKKKSKLEQQNASKEEIKDKLKTLYEIQWQLKLSHVYAYNACDKSGEVGILELKSTAHKAMKKMMNTYIKDYGQDPTSLNSDLKNDSGVWFDIRKEGEKKDTEYDVVFAVTKKKNADGELEKKDDRSPLSEHVVDNFEDLAYDLYSLYRPMSYDKLHEVLLANLALIKDRCPEAVLDYDVPDSLNAVSSVSSDEKEEVEVPKVKPAKKPIINLSDDDDDEDEPVVVKPAITTKKPKDIAALAESILGD